VSDKAAERRAKATVRNLVYSMLVTVGIVLLLILGVPRDDSNRVQPVAYQEVAVSASNAEGRLVLAPEIPAEWFSNAARIDNTLGVRGWYVGFVNDDNQFIGLSQAFETNASWESEMLKTNLLEGEIEIAGLTWEIWPTRSPSNPPGTKEFALKHNFGDSAVVIYGTAERSDFELIATSIAEQLK
jgi:hypothetical protein